MATKKRKRRRHNGAVKTWRFIKKQRRRRGRLHPTRRRQEDLAIIGALASVVLLVFMGPAWFVFSAAAACGNLLASKGTPPAKVKKRQVRNIRDLPKVRSNDLIKIQKRRSTCSDACKYSTHKVSTCDCVCGGREHGSKAAPNRRESTTPNKVRARRR